MKRIYSLFVLVLLLAPFLNTVSAKPKPNQAKAFATQTFELSKVMLHDVVSPPAAARFYAYSLLAAYQVVQTQNEELADISKAFTQSPPFAQLPMPEDLDPIFAATYAMLEVGEHIMPSGYLLEERKEHYTATYKKEHRLSKKAEEASKTYAMAVAQQVLQYAKTDGYSKLSTYTRYTPTQEEGRWYPTPPAYLPAVEPNWRDIRPFFLDSAAQFEPTPPAPFSQDTSSGFYAQMMDVYHTGKTLTQEQTEIANFWDCNPFAVQFTGHMAIGLKKISPGGHWIGITGIACEKARLSFEQTVMAHALVALTLHDAFISCWDEKYHSDRIRPETSINKYVDERWKPVLQTPPFPEYTSGHSVVSGASAVILTLLIGEDFAYDDSSEVFFGLPVRSFTSFYQAADEAAISRLYGGIHFRDAIEAGMVQGKNIGRFVLQQLPSLQPAGN